MSTGHCNGERQSSPSAGRIGARESDPGQARIVTAVKRPQSCASPYGSCCVGASISAYISRSPVQGNRGTTSTRIRQKGPWCLADRLPAPRNAKADGGTESTYGEFGHLCDNRVQPALRLVDTEALGNRTRERYHRPAAPLRQPQDSCPVKHEKVRELVALYTATSPLSSNTNRPLAGDHTGQPGSVPQCLVSRPAPTLNSYAVSVPCPSERLLCHMSAHQLRMRSYVPRCHPASPATVLLRPACAPTPPTTTVRFTDAGTLLDKADSFMIDNGLAVHQMKSPRARSAQ